MKLDTRFVRRQFPAFREERLKGLAHFDNAAGSYPCAHVVDRLNRFYRMRKVQPYAPSAPAIEGGAEMDEARARLAEMLGIGTDELSFGPSTTQNTYVLAQAFREALGPGDAIVVTNQDHEANTGAWRKLAWDGIEVREWRIDPETGHLDPAALAQLLDDRVRLVCFPHCSNILGEINDAGAITAMAHAAGAVTCVDGVAYAPHGLPDIGAIGADIYLFSTYKTFGPHQGIMVIRRDLAAALPEQCHGFNADVLTKRFTPAGPDHAQIAACAGIADYWDALYAHHHDIPVPARARVAAVNRLIRKRERKLMAPLLEYIRGRGDLRLLGPDTHDGRAPTVAVVCAKPGAKMAKRLAKHGIMTDGGDFYAPRPIEALGVDPDHGVLRLSFLHYTKMSEVARLIAALEQVL